MCRFFKKRNANNYEHKEEFSGVSVQGTASVTEINFSSPLHLCHLDLLWSVEGLSGAEWGYRSKEGKKSPFLQQNVGYLSGYQSLLFFTEMTSNKQNQFREWSAFSSIHPGKSYFCLSETPKIFCLENEVGQQATQENFQGNTYNYTPLFLRERKS